MMWRYILAILCALTVVAAMSIAPSIAAGGLLYPSRRQIAGDTPAACEQRPFDGEAVALSGWRCRATGKRRGTIVYLHGIADNRRSSRGVVDRYTRNGFDVIAYDSRRHGESGGEFCTYGFLEKRDLRRIVDTLPAGPVILVGTSLGGAVALQEAAGDARITAVVAAETFSDLRTVATERAPWFLPRPVIQRAFRIAEERGGFLVDAVSPMQAARSIHVLVLLIHGAEDRETAPSHSQRIYEALGGPRRLMLVPGMGHNQSLSAPGIWIEIDKWIEEALELRDRRFAEAAGSGDRGIAGSRDRGSRIADGWLEVTG